MTVDQFAALVELLRLRAGPAQECARLVLVDGMQVADAAQQAGISYKAGHAAVQRVREGLELASRAVGNPSISPRNHHGHK